MRLGDNKSQKGSEGGGDLEELHTNPYKRTRYGFCLLVSSFHHLVDGLYSCTFAQTEHSMRDAGRYHVMPHFPRGSHLTSVWNISPG